VTRDRADVIVTMKLTDFPARRSPGAVLSGCYLFVNAKMKIGELRVEILEPDGRVVEPFTLANCLPLSRDATKQAVVWKHPSSSIS